MLNFALPCLFASFVFLFLFIFLSIFNYKNRFHQSYDIRNHYPYELNYESKFKDNLLGNISVIVFAVTSIGFYTLMDGKYNNGFLLFTLIAGSIYSLALASLTFISFKSLRIHLLVVLLCIVLSFLIPFSNAFNLSQAYKTTKDATALVFMILNAVYCLIIFILMMNPKLSHWAELKEKNNPDGTVTYERPKYFILAFIEWFLIFTSPILMVLSLFTKLYII